MEQLFPELVHRDSQGYLSVAYADLSAVLVRAIQQQQLELDALRQGFAQLESELAALRAQAASVNASDGTLSRRNQ